VAKVKGLAFGLGRLEAEDTNRILPLHGSDLFLRHVATLPERFATIQASMRLVE
jgi:hypothetical protein